jgi:hypothetical protein
MIKKISIIVFFLSIFLFCMNLQFSINDNSKIIIFWMTLLLMISMILYQIVFLKKEYFIILFEIIIIFFILHLIFQIGYYGLRGNDSYTDYNFLKTILNNNHFVLGTDDISGWPLMHIFSSAISMITSINPLLIAKFFPSFISSIIVISIYLLIVNIYKNEKVALFSCLIFGTIPQFISFEALFVREAFAIYFLILFFYILYVSKQRNDYRFFILSIILIPMILLSHHFTSFMLLILLTIFVIFSNLIPFYFRNKPGNNFSKININTYYILILVVVIFYWLYFTIFIIRDFFSIYYEAIGVKEFVSYAGRIDLGTPIVTLNGNIKYYGFFFFIGLFSLILLIKILFKRNKNFIEDLSFTMFFYFCLFLGFLSLFVLGSLIFPDRFLPFGLMFGLIPIVMFLYSINQKNIKRILVVFLVSFLIFNLYNIDSSYYTDQAQINGGIASNKEYAIAETINMPNTYYGYIGASDAVYDIQGIKYLYESGKSPITASNIINDSNLAIIYEGMYIKNLANTKIKSPLLYDKISYVITLKNTIDIKMDIDKIININKISDLGDIYILEWAR